MNENRESIVREPKEDSNSEKVAAHARDVVIGLY